MKYKTLGNSNPKGKPRVYFTGHPADCKIYFDEITDLILKHHDCAVFYDEDPEHPKDEDNFISDLDSMQLVVIVVTSRYVYKDTFAHNVVFNHAIERHIPVLPILEEGGIETDFNKKCGDLQYIDPNSKDTTEIRFEEKLKKFLDMIFLGDELAQKVRNAFDKQVFLSYRKKDRRYAQELMRLIHKNDFCRDIAVWYDEFLVPSRDFKVSIREAMKKSELFVMAVTPNLLEEPNYIMSTEYPAAKELKKKILPAVLVPTDNDKLKDCYKSIPDLVYAFDNIAMFEGLNNALGNIAEQKLNNEPEHIFLIGLAYLNGIDVEVDHDRAVSLITSAAEAGLPEAIYKLVTMYRNGEGVRRSYETAIEWQFRLIETFESIFNSVQNKETASNLIMSLWHMGNYMYELSRITSATETYKQMLEVSMAIDKKWNENWAKEFVGVSYGQLGLVSEANMDLSAAKTYYEKSYEINKLIAEQTDSFESQMALSVDYNKLGNVSKAVGDISTAKLYYEKSLKIRERLYEKTGSVQLKRDLSVCYNHLGDISKAMANIPEAKTYYEKGLDIREKIAEQARTTEAQKDLSISFDNLGDISKISGDFAAAKNYYEKSLEIRRAIFKQTETAEAQRGLSVCEKNLGDISMANNDFLAAKEYYERAFKTNNYLAQQTQSVGSCRDLSVNYEKLGDVSKALKNLPAAKDYYEKAFEIRKELAEQTNTLESHNDLAIIYCKLGDISEALGDRPAARSYFEKDTEISKRIAEQTQTVQAQDDLASSMYNLALVSDSAEERQKYLKQCQRIWDELAQKYPTNQLYLKRLLMLYSEFFYILL